MQTPSQLIDPVFRFFVVVDGASKYIAMTFIVVGAIGWFTAGTNVRRAIAYRGVFVGALAALTAIFAMDVLYDLILWIMGTAFLPPGWPYTATGLSGITPFAQALAGILHYLGLAMFSIGMAFWAIGSPHSPRWKRGFRGVTTGICMLAVSVGGHLFAVFAIVL